LVTFLGTVVILIISFITAQTNYLLFHTLAEGWAVLVAFGIFIIAWQTRQVVRNSYLQFLGVGYFLWVFSLPFI
jgi:hypothetical protein